MRLHRYIIITAAIALLASCGFGTYLKKGDESLARGEYSDAAAYYRKAYSKVKPKNREMRGQIAWKMANCYRLINYAARASGAYTNAIRYKYPDSTALLYQGQVQLKMGRYNDARKSYDAYLDLDPDNVMAGVGRESCDLLPEWREDPTRYVVRKDKLFNGRRADYCPAYAGEDMWTIYFTSTRNEATGNEINPITGMKSADIFVATIDEQGRWQKPVLLESEVNSEYEDGACAFTPDGKTMYFTRCILKTNGPAYAQIYSSQRTGASWGAPAACELTRDSLSSYAHPAIDPTGTWNPIYVGAIAFACNKEWFAEKGYDYPTSWEDLLDPKYEGMVIMAHPATSGTAYTVLATLIQLKGEDAVWDYLKELDKNMSQYTKSGSAAPNAVALGEAAIALTFSHDGLQPTVEGYPIELSFPTDGTGYEVGAMALIKGGPADEQENAKKFIEKGECGGKGSAAHKAGVVGDTVGDPLKDTSGPSLNILMKLMAIVSLVFAPSFSSHLTGLHQWFERD